MCLSVEMYVEQGLILVTRLYINYGCPWAHRTNIVRSLKGLEDIIDLVVMSFKLTDEGW